MLAQRVRIVRRAAAALVLTILAAVLGACDETDVGSVKVSIKPDGSGTLLVNSLLTPPPPAAPAIEGASAGAVWQGRAAVVVSKGMFADLTKLKLADATFESTVMGSTHLVKLTLPRGPKALWPGTLSLTIPEARRFAAGILDPEAAAAGTPSKVGATIKFTLSLPAKAATAGLSVRARGVSEAAENNDATLIIPIDFAMADGEPIVWMVRWEEPAK